MKKIILSLSTFLFTGTLTCAAHDLVRKEAEENTLAKIELLMRRESLLHNILLTGYPTELKKLQQATLAEMRCTQAQSPDRTTLMGVDISTGTLWQQVYALILSHNGLNSVSHTYIRQCFPLKCLTMVISASVNAQDPDEHEHPSDNEVPTSNKRTRRE